MSFDPQKQTELREMRKKEQREKSRETLKKYSLGKNKGLAKKNIQSAKKSISLLKKPWQIFSLIALASFFTDWMYGLAFLAAIFKDVFDLIEATGVFYFIVILTTILTSIFIALMMLLGSFSNGSGNRVQRKIIRSWLTLLGGTTLEMLFGINFLPIETLTVFVIYLMMLADRKREMET